MLLVFDEQVSGHLFAASPMWRTSFAGSNRIVGPVVRFVCVTLRYMPKFAFGAARCAKNIGRLLTAESLRRSLNVSS